MVHRTFKSIAARLALITAGFLGATTPTFAGDWPQFLGPTRDGHSADTVATGFPATGPAVVWKMDVGQGYAGPAVSGGKVFVFHRVADEERIDCVDALTGKSIWSGKYHTGYQDDFGFDEGPRATPAVADGRVFTFGADGVLTAWEVASGKQLWTVDARHEFNSPKGFFGRVCSPLVDHGKVIVNIGSPGAGVVAFDAATGKPAWKATDDEAGYSSPTSADIGGKHYILSLTRAGLAAIEPASGKVYFRYRFRSRMDASVNAATPLVIDDQIFLSASYGAGATLLKFDESGPTKIWARDGVLSNHYATSVYSNGFLFGFDGRQEQGPNLTCIDLKTGEPRWKQENFGAGTLSVAGSNLVILTEKGELIIARASPEAYMPLARAQVLGFGVRAYAALADGLFYARDANKLVCVDLRAKK